MILSVSCNFVLARGAIFRMKDGIVLSFVM